VSDAIDAGNGRKISMRRSAESLNLARIDGAYRKTGILFPSSPPKKKPGVGPNLGVGGGGVEMVAEIAWMT
jgi:hypothetical protein